MDLLFANLLILIPSQRAFNEEFYEEGEDEKPVFEDDLDDEPGNHRHKPTRTSLKRPLLQFCHWAAC